MLEPSQLPHLLTVKQLREVVGPEILGRDEAYRLARVYGLKLGRKLVVPRRVVVALLEGELKPPSGGRG